MSAVDDAIKNAEFGDGSAWSDITGKPTEFPPESHTHNLAAINTSGADTGEVIKYNGTDLIYAPVAWAEITSKPTEFTPSSHNHTVSNLTQSGATTGQLLQWNGTAWVPATIATAGKEVITVIKAARQTVTNSTTFVADNHLTATLKSNKTYLFQMELFISAPSSGGFKYYMNTTDFAYGKANGHNPILGIALNLGGAGNITQNTSNAISITATNNTLRMVGRITVGVSDTNLLLSWAQNTANGTGTYLEENSFMKFTEV
jgi:hypothetical protein